MMTKTIEIASGDDGVVSVSRSDVGELIRITVANFMDEKEAELTINIAEARGLLEALTEIIGAEQ